MWPPSCYTSEYFCIAVFFLVLCTHMLCFWGYFFFNPGVVDDVSDDVDAGSSLDGSARVDIRWPASKPLTWLVTGLPYGWWARAPDAAHVCCYISKRPLDQLDDVSPLPSYCNSMSASVISSTWHQLQISLHGGQFVELWCTAHLA
jgi:hypothetical protein